MRIIDFAPREDLKKLVQAMEWLQAVRCVLFHFVVETTKAQTGWVICSELPGPGTEERQESSFLDSISGGLLYITWKNVLLHKTSAGFCLSLAWKHFLSRTQNWSGDHTPRARVWPRFSQAWPCSLALGWLLSLSPNATCLGVLMEPVHQEGYLATKCLAQG